MTDTTALAGATEAGAAGGNSAAQVRLASDTQSFLKLLTAQLTNQDPLSPVDPTQFVAQLAQFSTVEQAVESNTRLGEVLSQLRASGDRMDLAYLGREVEVESDRITLSAEGATQARYTVPEGADRVTLRILDADGTVVRTLPAGTAPGPRDLIWDGRGDGGGPLAPGSYRVEVAAQDSAGKALAAPVTITDRVARIRREDGETLFVLSGGQQVRRDSIVSAG
ncbi:MAG: putative basal-body rod modification protein FlgD [Pseudomonadota bacterium]|jgi:flagellar basal-body rod modification protein FlgD